MDPSARRAKAPQPQYGGQNVFAVLNDEADEQPQPQQQVQQPPAFMQPATFSFGGAPASSRFQFQPHAAMAADMDPDL